MYTAMYTVHCTVYSARLFEYLHKTKSSLTEIFTVGVGTVFAGFCVRLTASSSDFWCHHVTHLVIIKDYK
jgi:hypothetical protein